MSFLIKYQLISGVDAFLNILSLLLVVYAVMTWFVRPNHPVYVFMARIADFVIAPFRPLSNWLIGKGLRVDTSVILALIGIRLLRTLLYRLIW